MTLEQRVYEPEIRDYMTEDVNPNIPLEPYEIVPIGQSQGIVNLTDRSLTISIQLQNGKTLISLHE